MADHKPTRDNLSSIDGVEIEPLSDEALEDVAGGEAAGSSNCCSCKNCSTAEDEFQDS
jgi:hypothetical protein